MGNTFGVLCPEIMGTDRKLFLGSVKTSQLGLERNMTNVLGFVLFCFFKSNNVM